MDCRGQPSSLKTAWWTPLGDLRSATLAPWPATTAACCRLGLLQDGPYPESRMQVLISFWSAASSAPQFKHYPGTYHGFAIRGDKRGKDIRDAAIRDSQAEVCSP